MTVTVCLNKLEKMNDQQEIRNNGWKVLLDDLIRSDLLHRIWHLLRERQKLFLGEQLPFWPFDCVCQTQSERNEMSRNTCSYFYKRKTHSLQRQLAGQRPSKNK